MWQRSVPVVLTVLACIAAAVSGRAQEASAPHSLMPFDVIELNVLGQPDLVTQVRVDEQGRIAFPYIGLLNVEGLTVNEAAQRVGWALDAAGIAVDAEVVGRVVSFGARASVLGAVRDPGLFALDRPMTVTRLLAQAGGLADNAGNELILRRYAQDGTLESRTIDLDALLNRNDQSQNVTIRNADELYIPEAPVYYLYGQVNTPGAYVMRRPLSVQQALANGGGISELGSERRITIRRVNEAGAVVEFRAQLDDPVRPNDTIEVPERYF